MATDAEVEKRAKKARMEAGLMLFIGAALALWGLYGIVADDGVVFGIVMGAVAVLVAVLGGQRYSRANALARGLR